MSKSVNEILWDAVKSKNIDQATAAINDGADPNTFRIPSENGDTCEFHKLTESIDGHDNMNDQSKNLQEHMDYISVLMVAAQNSDIPMLNLLHSNGAEINLIQPNLVRGDGYPYGNMTAICYALHCVDTVTWFMDHGANVKIRIAGLPEYEDIPCEKFDPLLLSAFITKNEAVSRLLVERGGADVNYFAERNSGSQGGDTTICCYWRFVVASGDVDWARRLIYEFNADVQWPVINWENLATLHWPDSHPGFRATVLMTAVNNNDLPMVQLLFERETEMNQTRRFSVTMYSDSISCATEHINITEDLMEKSMNAGVFVPFNNSVFTTCLHECEDPDLLFENRRAAPLSLAIGRAEVPDSFLVIDAYNGLIYDVLEPYRSDPMIDILLKHRAKCHVAAARKLVDSEDIWKIMPTLEEVQDDVADISSERRAIYFITKRVKMTEGLSEVDAKEAAFAIVTADTDYDADSAFGTDYSDEHSDDILDRNTPDSTDDDSSVDYSMEEYECDQDGRVVIMDVVISDSN
jgi:hypothetical protein